MISGFLANTTILAVSGSRHISDADTDLVKRTIFSAVQSLPCLKVVRFGGAMGVDTVALQAFSMLPSVRLVVVVPAKLKDQPEIARKAIAGCGRTVDVLELEAPTYNTMRYHQRNMALIIGVGREPSFGGPVDGLLAFPRSRVPHIGGTFETMRIALANRIPCFVTPITGTDDDDGHEDE